MALVFQEDRDRPTCPACGFIHYVDPKVAVAVVVGDADGVLLGLRGISPGKGAWSFPSGYVNRGEVLEEAAAREVLEEMQFEVRITRLIGVYSTAGDPVILVAYAGEHVAGEPHPDGHESLEVHTFPLDALPPMAFSHDPRILADWQRIVLGNG